MKLCISCKEESATYAVSLPGKDEGLRLIMTTSVVVTYLPAASVCEGCYARIVIVTSLDGRLGTELSISSVA
jgi:hypothetical protein